MPENISPNPAPSHRISFSDKHENTLPDTGILKRYARKKILLAGQFKRGKSSLMNAIIGCELLPIGVLPLPSAITNERTAIRIVGTRRRCAPRQQNQGV